MQKTVVSLLLVVLGASLLLAENYKYEENIVFKSPDGTKLSGNLFTPLGSPGQKYPAIVFANSWGLEEHEYIVQAAKLAAKGYVVFSYSLRGWGMSDGKVTVAGPKDMQDVSAAIDWLLAKAPVDANKIGMAGISYGAGISLLAAAHDSRVKTAVAMSTWGNLITSLYGNETPRLVWGTILLTGGYLTGEMDPIIATHFQNLLVHKNIQAAVDWASPRSPASFISNINARNTPVYISNNFQDEIFQPNAILDLYSRLQVPKRLDLNLGVHASAELGGLIGISNYVWGNVHDWFDFWLKGIDTGIMQRPPVTMAVKGASRENLENWPSTQIHTKSWYLGKRGSDTAGSLRRAYQGDSGSDEIASGLFSGISTGVPVIGATFKALTPIEIQSWLPGTDPAISIVYESEPLTTGLKLRGIPRLELWIEPLQSQVQLIAHLYDLDFWGVGTLVTHMPVTLHQAVPGKAIKLELDLVATTHNFPKDHQLAIGIDTYDLNYAPPSLSSFRVKFLYGTDRASKLVIPFVE